jgi:AmmeMemoRadiSam system protein B
MMTRAHRAFITGVFCLTLCVAAEVMAEGREGPGNIRDSILAGRWYPGDPGRLRNVILSYLEKADSPPPAGELKAIIVPHAGYVYSGQVAAFAYGLLGNSGFKRIVMIGPSHRARFRGVSVNMQDGYRTPLGTVPVDRDFARRLLDGSDTLHWEPRAHAGEHSLEIQIPFLQTVLSDFSIVPILMGEQDYETCQSVAAVLGRVIATSEATLILASTDLSHFHSYQKAKVLDAAFIRHVAAFDPPGLAQSLISGKCEACGAGPTITVLLAAKLLGANRADILRYANSGDVSGDHSRVVGYLSAALSKE